VTQQAKLDREAEPVGRAVPSPDEREVRRVHDAVLGHLGALDRNAE
jgi:hypothetical protein